MLAVRAGGSRAELKKLSIFVIVLRERQTASLLLCG
jgi:hypothetical protein